MYGNLNQINKGPDNNSDNAQGLTSRC